MEKEIENLIEELTKVRPSMLNEEALKLFNTIMAVLNENAELKKNYINPSKGRILYYDTKKGTEVVIEGFVPKSKIKEIRDKAEVMDYYTLPDVIDDLNKLLGDEN